MDKFEIRRLNLRSVMRSHCDDKAVNLANKIGREPSYVSRMLASEEKAGRKRIGEDMRDFIESALLLPKGTLDDEATAVVERDGGLAATQPLSAEVQSKADEPVNELGQAAPITLEQARQLIPGVRPIIAAGPDDARLVHIPKIKLRLAAGVAGIQVDPERFDGSTWTLKATWIEKKGFTADQLIATDVGGESMLPGLHPGDVVIVNLADTKPVDGAVYAFNYEGEPVIKRLTRDAGKWWLTSDNPDQVRYYRRVCEGDACIIVGRVVRKESDHL